VISFDRVHGLLEHRAMLLDASGGLLLATIAMGRAMTAREQDNWDWAMQRITQLEEAYSTLITEMADRHYYPADVPRPGGYEIRMGPQRV
jgi:hypothetical protein